MDNTGIKINGEQSRAGRKCMEGIQGYNMLHPVNLKPSSEHKLMLMIIKHEFKYHTVVNRIQRMIQCKKLAFYKFS